MPRQVKSKNLVYTPYVYRIIWKKENTGLEYDIHYIGSKYGEGAHPDLFWIDYFTSSDRVHETRKIYGEPQIRKYWNGLISCRETWNIILEYEGRILKYLKVVPRSDYLNEHYGAKGWGGRPTGLLNTTNAGIITVEEYWSNPDQYRIHSHGKVPTINDGFVDAAEFWTNREKYNHLSDGMVNTTNHGSVTQEEFWTNREKYTVANEGIVITKNAGHVTKDEFWSNREKYTQSTEGTVSTKNNGRISQEEFWNNREKYIGSSEGIVFTKNHGTVTQEEFWANREQYVHPCQGTVITKNAGRITLEEYKLNPDKYVTTTKGLVFTNNAGWIPKEEYRKNRHLYQFCNTGKKGATVVATGQWIKTSEDDIRWVTGEIIPGWKKSIKETT